VSPNASSSRVVATSDSGIKLIVQDGVFVQNEIPN